MEANAAKWWQDFYCDVTLDFIRSLEHDAERTRDEATFLERTLRLAPGARVLDVPCGKGRHAVELAARGFHVTGVDMTAPFLDDARQEVAQRGLTVQWEQRDMRDLPWAGEFDAACCFGGSFGFFDDDGNSTFLQAVSRTLKPGGRFALDTLVLEALLPKFQERSWQRWGDRLICEARRYDLDGGRVEAEWVFVRGGQTATRHSSIRIYTYRELCVLLAAAGFGECEAYGNIAGEPFRLGSRRIYIAATRTGA
jgi:SAM-dependent methyltransferase